MTPRPPPSPSAAPPARTLQAIVRLVAVATTAITPLVYLGSRNPLEVMAPIVIAVAAWSGLLLLRLGYQRLLASLMVYVVLLAAVIDVLAFGSVRTAASFLFVAAIAGAGIFLNRAGLLATVVISIATLGGLTLAEYHGLLQEAHFTVGLNVWLTHTVTMVIVAIMVHHATTRAQQAIASQQEELERRVRSEQARDRSVDRFSRIFRNNPSPMVAQSAVHGRILDVNPAFERCYGYPAQAILGRDDTRLWAWPEQRQVYLQRLIEHRSVHQFACVARRADGSTFDAMISSEMGSGQEDQLVITTVTDISIQTEQLERLRRSEERFARAFNLSPMSMLITRLSDGSLLEVNRAGSSDGTVTWPTIDEHHAFVARLRRQGRIDAMDTRMRLPDGSLKDMRLWAVLIDIDGEECVLSCSTDIAHEKRREQLLTDLALAMAGDTGEALLHKLCAHMARSLGADMTSIAELRSDGRMHTLAANVDGRPVEAFAYELAGTPCERAMEKSETCEYLQDADRLFPHDRDLVEGGFKAYVGKSLLDEDGHAIGVVNALWRRPVALDAAARSMMAICASRASAELMRLRRDRQIQRLNETLEWRVHQRTAELVKLNAELDSFAYSVSHDLKSPLRAIDGFTRLLGEQLQGRLSLDEEQLFDRVLASTRRMSTLIADLLALARVSQGTLELETTDLSAMAESALAAEQAKFPERSLRWRVEPGLSCMCDPRLVRIALENLVANAVKYTRPRDAPFIEVGLVPDRPAAHRVFYVRDNGVGFDMAYVDKLFKPFQRLHQANEFEGTGIGLATVRRIVERHGGQISCHASPGHGAEFRFSLGATPTPS